MKTFRLRKTGFTPTPERAPAALPQGAKRARLVWGFTLVEALVALFVLSIALVGATSVIVSQIGISRLIKESFIANGLAQEGIEVVRNMRDSEWFATDSFGNALPTGTWRVQWNSTSLIPESGDNPPLTKNAAGFYGYDTGSDVTATIFRRLITINQAGDEIKATVTVTWDSRGTGRSLSAEEHLFNWNKQ